MARSRTRRTGQRIVVDGRESAPVRPEAAPIPRTAQAQAAVSRATQDVLGRLSSLTQGVALDRTKRKYGEDLVRGQQDRTSEITEGAEVASEDRLQEMSHAYRRGYHLTEASNRITRAQIELRSTLAGLDVDDDPMEYVEAAVRGLQDDPMFQDPQVMDRMLPAIERMQADALDYHGKVMLDEAITRQTENLTEMVRMGIQDGSMLSAEGLQAFLRTVDTEEFGYRTADEALDMYAEQMFELVSSGAVDPEQATEFLKEKHEGLNVSLWDRRDPNGHRWGARFQQAAESGTAVQQAQIAEQRAEMAAQIEYGLRQRANAGALTEAEILDIGSNRLGYEGKELEQFTRRWVGHAIAGQNRLREQAEKVSKNEQVLAALLKGQGHAYTHHEQAAALGEQYQRAILAGDEDTAWNIAEVAAADYGIVIPQIRDQASQITMSNIADMGDLMDRIVRLDPIVAARILSEDNAVLIERYRSNWNTYGMSHEEAVAALPTGEHLGTRQRSSQLISGALRAFWEDNGTDRDGDELPPWAREQIVSRAQRYLDRNELQDPAAALSAARHNVLSTSEKLRGQLVPIGGMRPVDVESAEAYLDAVSEELLRDGTVTPEQAEQLRVVPHADDAQLFTVTLPEGFPVVTKDGETKHFHSLENARAYQEWQDQQASYETLVKRFADQNKDRLHREYGSQILSLSQQIRTVDPREVDIEELKGQRAALIQAREADIQTNLGVEAPAAAFVEFLQTFTPKDK